MPLLRAVSERSESELGDDLQRMSMPASPGKHREAPPRPSYSSTCSYRKAAYRSLLRKTRQAIMSALLARCHEHFPDIAADQPELVAHHYAEADLAEQSIAYWRRAGQRALQRAANIEAIAHLERAANLLSSVTDLRTREALQLEIELALAPAYMAIKGWASLAVETTCRRALELSTRQNSFPGMFGSLWGLWTNYFLRGKLQDGLGVAEEC